MWCMPCLILEFGRWLMREFSYWADAWMRFKANRPAYTMLWVLGAIVAFACVVPLVSPYSYSDIQLDWKNHAPCMKFWFGTDELGRDLFTRVWWGARISLFVGVVAATIDVVLGMIWGSVAAYVGGKVDEVMMRVVDVLNSIPYLLVVILLTVIRGSGIGTIILAMTLTGWINMARITRGQMLQLKTNEYVAAARLIGASTVRIVFKHLLPNAIRPIVATLT
jgi:oligopeptide transport system permease protein